MGNKLRGKSSARRNGIRFAMNGIPNVGDLKRKESAEKQKCPPHKWDEDGERCLRCGAKDWMT